MKHGRKHEKAALKKLFDNIKPRKVYKSGLITSILVPFLAGTPDAIIIDKDGNRAVVEVKCPETIVSKQRTLDQFNWIVTNELGKAVAIRETHAYFYQIQFQIFLAKCDYGYFYVHSPDSLSTDQELMILKINRRDDLIWKEMLTLGETCSMYLEQ